MSTMTTDCCNDGIGLAAVVALVLLSVRVLAGVLRRADRRAAASTRPDGD